MRFDTGLLADQFPHQDTCKKLICSTFSSHLQLVSNSRTLKIYRSSACYNNCCVDTLCMMCTHKVQTLQTLNNAVQVARGDRTRNTLRS